MRLTVGGNPNRIEWIVTFHGLSNQFNPNDFGPAPIGDHGRSTSTMPIVVMHMALFALNADGDDTKPDLFTFGC